MTDCAVGADVGQFKGHHEILSIDDGISCWRRRSGEQWIFTRDRATGAATLRGADVDWATVHIVRDGRVEGLILNAEEAAWLQACWSAASALP